jgi:chemotaxis family two-component system sensor kinase Cph1
MVRLFQNLIGNAIKFHSDDPLEVNISTHRKGHTVELVVEDNGIGVDASATDSIFNMFKRLHTQDEYPGTGMGLALCRRIASLHGGTIWATPRTKPERGLSVHFTISLEGPRGDNLSRDDQVNL